jgi:hypothetical protein
MRTTKQALSARDVVRKDFRKSCPVYSARERLSNALTRPPYDDELLRQSL